MSLKRMMVTHTAPLISLLLVAGCQPPPAVAGAQGSTEADIAAIKEQSALFSQAYVDGDLELQMSIYADDAVIAPPGRPFIDGQQLRQYWAPAQGREVVSHRTIPVEIVVSGDVAYDWGRYEGAAGPIGAPSEFWGKYLIVWRRGDDGIWRMVQDMWNDSPQ